MTKIAYLGMGTMGRGMAGNLIKAGHDVTVWNRTPDRCADLVARGAKQAATPAEAVDGAEVIMYCLSDDAAVEDLVWGAGGLLDAVKAGQIVVDMTTLHPSTSLKEAAAYKAKGAKFLDAPVFGSKNEAANGGLWIVVGRRPGPVRVRPAAPRAAERDHPLHGRERQGRGDEAGRQPLRRGRDGGAGRSDDHGDQGRPESRGRPGRAPRHRLQDPDLRRRGQRADQPGLLDPLRARSSC